MAAGPYFSPATLSMDFAVFSFISRCLADAIENDSFMDDYYYMAVDEYDLYDDLYAAGMDWNKFMYEK